MKSLFLTPLSWRQIGVRKYLLTSPLIYYSELLDGTVEAPAGRITDGESCPVWLPIINSMFGNLTNEGAVIHDELYTTQKYSREVCDKVLVEAIRTMPEPPSEWRIMGIYYGLRIGGWLAWNQHKRDNLLTKEQIVNR